LFIDQFLLYNTAHQEQQLFEIRVLEENQNSSMLL